MIVGRVSVLLTGLPSIEYPAASFYIHCDGVTVMKRKVENFEPFICPITRELMRDPVIAPSGHSYERTAITRALQCQPRDPMTREPLTLIQLVTNIALRDAIAGWHNIEEEYAAALRVASASDPIHAPRENGYFTVPLNSEKLYQLLEFRDAFQALEVLLDKITTLHILQDVLSDTLLHDRDGFMDYLENVSPDAIERIVKAGEDDDAIAEDREILEHCLKYKFRDCENVWPHAAILQALAHVRGVELRIWEAGAGDSREKRLEKMPLYHVYLPPASAVRARMPKSEDSTFVESEAQGYRCHEVLADGSCGYTAFGITRSDAHKLLSERVADLGSQGILRRAVRAALLTRNFFDYLRERGVIGSDVSHDTVIDSLGSYMSDLAVLQGYLDYDVREGRIDSGWAHPSVLQGLAFVRSLELRIWRRGSQGELLPHRGEMYDFSEYQPSSGVVNGRVDLLFSNGNHFERLEFSGYTDGFPEVNETIFPLDIGLSQRKQLHLLYSDEGFAKLRFKKRGECVDQLSGNLLQPLYPPTSPRTALEAKQFLMKKGQIKIRKSVTGDTGFSEAVNSQPVRFMEDDELWREVREILWRSLHEQFRQQAKEGFEDLINRFPDEAWLHVQLGILYSRLASDKGELENYYKAIECYKEALKIDPKNHIAHRVWGWSLDRLANTTDVPDVRVQRLEDALRCCDKAIAIKPTYSEAYENKGKYYRELAASMRRKEDLERKMQYGETGEKERDFLYRAEFCFKEALKLDSSRTAGLLLSIGEIRKQTDDYNGAQQCFEESITGNPKNEVGYVKLGNLFKDRALHKFERRPREQQEFFDRAIESFEAGLALNPDNVEIRVQLAFCLLRTGKVLRNVGTLRTAKDHYERVLELQPGNDTASTGLEKVRKAIDNLQKERTNAPRSNNRGGDFFHHQPRGNYRGRGRRRGGYEQHPADSQRNWRR